MGPMFGSTGLYPVDETANERLPPHLSRRMLCCLNGALVSFTIDSVTGRRSVDVKMRAIRKPNQEGAQIGSF